LCPSCRARRQARSAGTLCFQCYRLQLGRDRAIKAAGTLFTGSEERFQFGLPFEPVNKARLAALRVQRTQAKAGIESRGRSLATKRREAQMAARRALETIGHALRVRGLAPSQFPEAWLPFVASR